MQRALQTYTSLALLMAAILAAPSVQGAAAPTAKDKDKDAKKTSSKTGDKEKSKDKNEPKGKAGKPAEAETPTNAAPVEVEIPKSNFAFSIEAGAKDPFFPDTSRFQRTVVETGSRSNKVAVVAPEVKINGFTGNPAQPLVILNNVTFGIGDETSVPTPAGRARVRCVEIRVEDQIAVVEINGVRRELKFASRR